MTQSPSVFVDLKPAALDEVSSSVTVPIPAPATRSCDHRRRDSGSARLLPIASDAPASAAAAEESHGAYFSESLRVLKQYGVAFQMPNLLSGVGSAMFTTLVPVICRQVLHVDDALSGTILSMSGIGRVIGNVPVSALSHSWGAYTTMWLFTLLYGFCQIFLPVTNMALWALVASSFLQGVCAAGGQTPRSELIQAMIPKKIRSRLSSHIGGTSRMGYIIGPILAGYIYQQWSVHAVFYVSAPMFAIAAACIFTSEDMRAAQDQLLLQQAEEKQTAIAAAVAATGAPPPKPHPLIASVKHVAAVACKHHNVILRVGFFTGSIFSLRNARRFLLSLVALSLNLSAHGTLLVVAGSYSVDAVLFWVGALMEDRFGRNYAAIPLCTLLSAAFVVLACADRASLLIVAAVLFGLAECFGAGLLISVSTAIVPREAIGLTRVLQDSGELFGPLIAGALASRAGLPASCLFMAAWAAVAAVWVVHALPPPLPTTCAPPPLAAPGPAEVVSSSEKAPQNPPDAQKAPVAYVPASVPDSVADDAFTVSMPPYQVERAAATNMEVPADS